MGSRKVHRMVKAMVASRSRPCGKIINDSIVVHNMPASTKSPGKSWLATSA
jgi:hypothetical protein